MKLRLVDNWRHAWKWASVHSMAFSLTLIATWTQTPDSLRQSLPNGIVEKITIVVLILGLIGRLVTKDAPNADVAENIPDSDNHMDSDVPSSN